MCANLSLPTVIILASGRGVRFTASGGATHKLQSPLAGKTVLQRTRDAVQASGLPWHLEDAGHPAMGDSIAAAVRATSQAAGWLILPGDLPLIQSGTLRALAAALSDHEVVVPVYQEQRGHPVGFQALCGPVLLKLEGKEGAASVVLSYAAIELIVSDIGCVADIDTVEDLRTAARLMRGA